jgi:signal transduction histidine kinase
LRKSQALALAGQFAAATMHEVNGPLEAITNLNYLVQTNSDDGEQVRNFSGLIYEQLLVLSSVSRQTLSFYHSRETVEPIPIAPLAEAALRIHRQKIAAKEIRLLKKLPGDVIVESHAGAMLQVFSNLIGNAIEALPVQGTLQIRSFVTRRS